MGDVCLEQIMWTVQRKPNQLVANRNGQAGLNRPGVAKKKGDLKKTILAGSQRETELQSALARFSETVVEPVFRNARGKAVADNLVNRGLLKPWLIVTSESGVIPQIACFGSL